MFEKEADFAETKMLINCNGDYSKKKDYKKGWQDGAEFGYNKANEWNIETPSSAVDNKDLLLRVAKDDFAVGYFRFENKRFYTNDGQEVIPLAWKEIHCPQEGE